MSADGSIRIASGAVQPLDSAVGINGPPGTTGFAGGRPKVEEIVAYWPALIPKSEITPTAELLSA